MLHDNSFDLMFIAKSDAPLSGLGVPGVCVIATSSVALGGVAMSIEAYDLTLASASTPQLARPCAGSAHGLVYVLPRLPRDSASEQLVVVKLAGAVAGCGILPALDATKGGRQ